MRIQKAPLLFFTFIFWAASSIAQQAAALDSMKSSFAKAKTAEEKVFWLDMLSRTAMNVNPGQADEYGKQLITFAEIHLSCLQKEYLRNNTGRTFI